MAQIQSGNTNKKVKQNSEYNQRFGFVNDSILQLRKNLSSQKRNVKSNKSGGLQVDPDKTATEILEELLGEGFQYNSNVFNATLIGASSANGFVDGENSNLGFSNGIIFATGNAITAEGPNDQGSASGSLSQPGDVDLNAITGIIGTNDASGIEFDFIPGSDTIKFSYVFGSEEYCQFVNQFNDVFAFFLTSNESDSYNYSNENIALVPGTSQAVSINTINHGSIGDNIDPNVCVNCEFYVDNQPTGFNDPSSIQYDGFTTVLTAWALVTPCKEYHIKIVIADDVDNSLDSGVFLKSNSFSASGDAIEVVQNYSNSGDNHLIEGCNDLSLDFNTEIGDEDTYIDFELLSGIGQAQYGVDYTTIPPLADYPEGSLVIPAGQTSVSIVFTPIEDGISENSEEISLLFTSNLGCEGSSLDTVVINIQDHSGISIQPFGDEQIDCGENTSLWVHTSGGYPPYNYNWSNGIADADSINVLPLDNETFTVNIEDECGFSNQYSFNVNVTPIECNFAYQLQNNLVAFQSYNMENMLSYNWNFGDGSNSTENDPVHSFNEEDIYNVELEIEDEVGCANSRTKEVSVEFPEIYFEPDSIVVDPMSVVSQTVYVDEVVNLAGFSFEIHFNPDYLQIDNVNLLEFIESTGRTVIIEDNAIDNENGILVVSVSSTGENIDGPSGSGALIQIDWIATENYGNNSIETISFQQLQVFRPDGSEILSNNYNSIIQVNECFRHDFECDCDVDILDITTAAYYYGTEIGDELYNTDFDFDNDGDIDILDITSVSYNYGWACD